MDDNAIRVFVVDEHPVIRNSLKVMFAASPRLVLCGEAGSSEDAMRTIPMGMPHVVVLGLSVCGDVGYECLHHIKKGFPSIRILVLSIHDEAKYALRAIKEGAVGYVMKTAQAEFVMNAIVMAHEGKWVVSEGVQQQLLHAMCAEKNAPAQPEWCLSGREWQVFRELGEGLTMKEIAAHMQISIKTVGSMCERIKKKLRRPRLRDVAQYATEWFGAQSE